MTTPEPDPDEWKYKAAQQLLDLHEATLKAVEGGPAMAEEWVKLRQDYTSMCSTVAAVLAALVLDRRSPKREDVIESISGKIVQCVVCLDEQGECVHIFSTRDKLEAFIATDPRRHVVYDYMIDNPDRMEKPFQ